MPIFAKVLFSIIAFEAIVLLGVLNQESFKEPHVLVYWVGVGFVDGLWLGSIMVALTWIWVG